MLVTLLIRLVIVALAFGFTAWVFDGVELSGGVFGGIRRLRGPGMRRGGG